jgi:hypothetical protein
MAGLPHFTNSVAAINYYEPLFLNQFEVIINPPAGVVNANTGFGGGESVLTQQVKSITGLKVDIQPANPVEQNYKFATRRYAGGEPSTSDMELTMEFEVNLDDANSMVVYKTLRQWSDLIYNPQTGAMGLKVDYVGSLLISIFNKRGDVYRRIRIPSCFITTPITAMELDYDNGSNIYTISLNWKCDYWEDLFL